MNQYNAKKGDEIMGDLFNMSLEFLYGWMNSSWMSYLSFILAILSLLVGGIGIFIEKKYQKKIGVLITVISVLFFIYAIGIPIYNSGLVTGISTKDDIVYNNIKKEYQEEKLIIPVKELQFSLIDKTDGSNCQNFTTEVSNIEEKIEKFEIEHIDTGNIYREYSVENNKIVLNHKVLNGNYKVCLKLKGYENKEENIELTSKGVKIDNENELNGWWKSINLTKVNSSPLYSFNVRLLDQNYSPLVNFRYSMGLEKNEQLAELYTNENGYLKYEFLGHIGKSFYINAEYPSGSNTIYSKKIVFEEKNKTIDVIFKNESKDLLIQNDEIVDKEYENLIKKKRTEAASNIPNDNSLLPYYYIGFENQVYEIDSMSGGFPKEIDVSSCKSTLFDIHLKFDFNTADKSITLNTPTGQGFDLMPSNDNTADFKASSGLYTIEVYDKESRIFLFKENIEVNKNSKFNIDYIN